jgi:hypothetical protein
MAEAMMCDKMLYKLRRNIVTLRERYKKCDSLSKRAELMGQYDTLTKTLKESCPHKLVVVDYSQSFDYEENCTVSGQHHCIVCGTIETGYNAEINMREYKWCSGTYKVLLAEPFSRFGSGPGYGKDSAGFSQGRWDMGNDLDNDLDTLLEWIKKYGYRHMTAAEHKAYDEQRAADEAEQRYQAFKKENYARLKKEFFQCI